MAYAEVCRCVATMCQLAVGFDQSHNTIVVLREDVELVSVALPRRPNGTDRRFGA